MKVIGVNVLRKVDIVFKKGVMDIIFIGITISKIIILEGKTNFKGIFVKFMLTNMAIKEFTYP